jgi:D-alanyl-lipoteichoic acid acyltransferase DltB (MBOAT superfamily)
LLFNSLQFLIFFPLVVGLFFATPQRWRWLLLLVASYVFYGAWKIEYLGLIWFSTGVDYLVARLLERWESPLRRRLLLGLTLVSNLGLLFVFKYWDFAAGSVAALLAQGGIVYAPTPLPWLLPVGISFYTFQTLAYTIDVYRGRQVAERHLGRFALYVAFFPQLVAGPIERSQRLLPQFLERQRWDAARAESGLRLMAWGFFKKLVIADRLALLVNGVYGQPQQFGSIPLILATLAFAYQIYCDFSGYSDIAIGAARVMGFRLMLNFDRPYAARSVGDFWHRWHISLSTWFRDYLYIPLGGNRGGKIRVAANLMLVFVISGLWHGASWTFVIWGGLHGLYLLAERALAKPLRRLWTGLGLDPASRLADGLRWVVTFALVAFAWIFFRADSLADAAYVAGHLLGPRDLSSGYGMGIGAWNLALALVAIALLELVQWRQARGGMGAWLDRLPRWQRWSAYYALGFSILLFGRLGVAEFIYFQF